MIEIISQYSDILLAIASIAFSVSLFLQLVYNYRNRICEIPYSTSVPTAFSMAVVTLVYLSNTFILSTVLGSITTVVWSVIAMQRYHYRTEESCPT